MARLAGVAWRLLAVAGVVAYPVLLHVGVTRGAVEAPVLALAALPHTAAYLFMLWLFGRTLLGGREPIITRVARRVRGTLPPELETYTRRLTAAWCVFFAGQLAVSALLFGFDSVENWSFFVSVLNFPLVALMFVGDWLYRVVRYPHLPQSSIAKAVKAFVQDRASSPLPR
jgi:uncharacterized membrane protein